MPYNRGSTRKLVTIYLTVNAFQLTKENLPGTYYKPHPLGDAKSIPKMCRHGYIF